MDLLTYIPSLLPATEDALYSCSLINDWSQTNHPVGYDMISDDAHWTAPVLVSHNNEYEMWAPGQMASAGVQRVAEVRIFCAFRCRRCLDSLPTGDKLDGLTKTLSLL
jgi:hypothetical protein